ncbi:MAG: leucine-rich repeat domain-containing protein [Chloroflexota bacterium]
MAYDEAYRKAESKIEEALRPKLATLELCSMGLHRVPEAIAQLAHLQSLDLSRNQLEELTELIGYLTQLNSLDLSHNQLSVLPDSIGNLSF